MITITTGQPGAGKSLYTLFFVNDLATKESRPVYYSGIPDLKLPWIELDNAEQWHTLPAGAIIVIDECQRIFRPRGTGATVPEYVAKLETHRHNGYDLFLITQHPMLVDTNVRRLIGRHFHVQRTFGMQRAVVHEFTDLRQEPDKSREGSIRHDFSYPKEVFTWYKSAEIHTVKRRVPARLIFLLILPLIFAAIIWAIVAWWQAKSVSKTGTDGGLVPTTVPVNGQSGASAPVKSLTTEQYLQMHQPRIPGLAYTAPVYDKVMEVRTAPRPSACVASYRKCVCYTDQVTRLDMPESLCRQIAEKGFFDPTKGNDLENSQLQAPKPVQSINPA